MDNVQLSRAMVGGQTSIVLVSYYTGPVLFQAIEHALAAVGTETGTADRVIVVDNGNPPDVADRLRGIAMCNPAFMVISGHGNIGFGRACNMGVQAANADYILLLNPDAFLPEGAIPQLMKATENVVAPFMFGARLVDEDGRDQRGCRRALLTPKTALVEALHLYRFFPEDRLNFMDDPMPDKPVSVPAISGAFMFLPRTSYWSIGGFDEEYFLHVEDLDFCLRFRRKGGDIIFVPHIVVTHVGGTSDVPSSFTEIQKTKGFWRYFHKNFGPYVPKPLMMILYVAIGVRAGIKLSLIMARRMVAPRKAAR